MISATADSVSPRESKWDYATDSKGFRILKNQVVDLQQRLQDEVVTILKDSIIYEDGESKFLCTCFYCCCNTPCVKIPNAA
jgi:hypothetical protein